MKKLIFIAAVLVAGSITSYALSNNTLPVENTCTVLSDKFKEIPVDKVPMAITNNVKKDFATATISKAYVNSSEQYKLVLAIKGSQKVVYADKNGNWLEKDKISEEPGDSKS